MSFVAADLTDHVLTLTIQRPEVFNAIDDLTAAALGRHLDEAKTNDDVRVVIITGVGKAFCAGFDLGYAERNPEVYNQPLFASEIVRRPPGDKPMIAAVNGIAMGLGFELALACDLIVASDSAIFALPETKVGLAAMGGGVARLARTIGVKRTLGITLTARNVKAVEGVALGFVNEVTDGDVLACAKTWAAQIAIGGPLSLSATQEIANRAADLTLEESLDPRSYPAVMTLLASEDAVEGRHAFLEKRKPQWKGR